MTIRYLRTVLGDIPADSFGLILPHEHLFTDLRGPEVNGYAQADPKDVLSVMLPYLKAAHQAGATGLVECTTIGVGRNIEILRVLAESTRVHLLVPTGLYRDDFIPAIYRDQSLEEIANLFVLEITRGIGISRSKAGFIKIAMSDDGPRPIEKRNLRAAARASQATGAAIASHTIGGKAAMAEIEILKNERFGLEKFIWVHAGSESDISYHLAAASEGVTIEFDSIGSSDDAESETIRAIQNLLDHGFSNQILLSHDAGWFQPGRPGGEPEHGLRGFTALMDTFVPSLREAGISDETIDRMTKTNPLRVFALTA